MRGRGVFLGSMVVAAAAGACVTQTKQVRVDKTPAAVAPVKPKALEPVRPARFVLMNTVGVMYDETGEGSPIRSRDNAIVAGKRLVLDGGTIVESASFPDELAGFRSLPSRLGGGYVIWSREHVYRASTFLGKLTPFANIGARGGVRPWFDSFVLRTEIGPLEVNPRSLEVRRTELARFSEMISLDGKIGVRTAPIGRMEASVDGGKTFRPLGFDDGTKLVGPTPGPSDALVFRRETSSEGLGMRDGRQPSDMRVLNASGALVPFDPWAHLPLTLTPQSLSAPPEEPALTRNFAPAELGQAVVVGAVVPGNRIVFVRETSLRVLSATTGEFIQDVPFSLGSHDFGRCQPIMLGEDLFLACTHASGAHLLALRGTPTTVELEATFPEPSGFVAGLGQRFAFLGRCGSTPPTVRDFPGYASADEAADGGEPDPNAPPPPPDPETTPEPPPPGPRDEAAVCVRLKDGTWVERRIEGLRDRDKAFFLPDDDGNVTVVLFDKPSLDKPTTKASEGVRFIHVDPHETGFKSSSFFVPYVPSDPKVRTIFRDVWLDEKDGSVHGWEVQWPEDEERSAMEVPDDGPVMGTAGIEARGRIVGVQIKPDGTLTKHSLPDAVDTVVVSGPYAVARTKAEDGPKYYESVDGGKTFVPVAVPVPGEFIESAGGEIEGCSIAGCALGGGLVRLGWGDGSSGTTASANEGESIDLDALTANVFDPHTLVPPKPIKQIHCRVEDTGVAFDRAAPSAVTTQTRVEVNVGSVVDRKWTALGTTPFELRPPHQVLFEDVDVRDLKGEGVPVLRSTATNPVGLVFRADNHRFDLTPGPKRKPVAVAPRGTIAAEIDRDTFVFFDPRSGELHLVKGSTARQVMDIDEVADVTHAGLTLARRATTGPDVLALAIVQSGSGDILLGDLDLGRMVVGPLRVVGNMRKLVTGRSCVRTPRDYRMVIPDGAVLEFEPSEGRGGLSGSSLITVGSGDACLEATEFELPFRGMAVVRFSEGGPDGFPAMVHERGKSLRARCVRK
ncbi:MAG: hypothetical protein IPM54_34900 [Polyangiaceae bacterium]|nr:hypothetical protein [Polyangiaceae bacterium]